MNIFEKFLMEADGPPDLAPDIAPPELPDDPTPNTTMDDPPLLTDEGGGDMTFDDPPALGDGDDFGMGDDQENQDQQQQMQDADIDGDGDIGLDDKVSAVMNVSLYQRYLSLLTNISQELSSIRNNNDIIYTLSEDTTKIVDSLNRLDENIRLYMKNSFPHENYSKNLLFFNKCLNLLKLLNDSFNSSIKKGMHSMK